MQLGKPRTSGSGWFARFDLKAAQEVITKLRNGKCGFPMKSQAHVLEDPRLSCALFMIENLELREMRTRMRGEVPLQ